MSKPSDTRDKVRFTVDLNDEERKKLRLLASVHDLSMSEMMRAMIHEFYSRSAVREVDFSNENLIGA